MKNFFLSLFLICFLTESANAATHEFSSVEEAQANAAARNREVLQQAGKEDKLPTNESEMIEFLRERIDKLDITQLSEGERIDKPSSFSKVDESESVPQKSFLEKIYDNAIARVSGNVQPDLKPVEYYAPQETEDEVSESENTVPAINIVLPDGMNLRAPAYEHIPLFSTQIEILPNQMLKVYENVVVIANGNKVKNGLLRFIKKEAVSGKNKIQLMLDEVKVNGTVVPYELVEQNDYYVVRPVHGFTLPEGVYVFEYRYLADRYLWDYGDFYEFYWDLTGGHFNLLVNRAIAAIKLPGREPAIKRYALTGKASDLTDKNAVVMKGENNTIGFMNLFPLMSGESLHVFMTVPKVDFLPVSRTQKIVHVIEDYGDIALSFVYLLITLVSSILSWRYIRKKLKFKNINLSSSLLVRALWRGAADKKAVGCLLLDLFRKNVIDIQQRDEDIILVRKSSHTRSLSKFENKVMALLFSKKDSISKLTSGKMAQNLAALVYGEAETQVKRIGLKLSSMYILFNILILLSVEMALCWWNENAMMFGILCLVDIALFVMLGAYLFIRGAWWQKVIMGSVSVGALVIAALMLSIYLNWVAVLMLLMGIGVAFIFNQKAAAYDALLKNAVQSACKLREFLFEQKASVSSGRNFAVQQANIFALDLEDEYAENPKIKSVYRLNEVKKLLQRIY